MSKVDDNYSQKSEGGQTKRKCPMCGKEVVTAYRPFCSKRCADVDLNRWFSEGYKFSREVTNSDFDE